MAAKASACSSWAERNLGSVVPEEQLLDLLVELAGEAALEVRKIRLAEEAVQWRLLQHEVDLAWQIQLGILPDAVNEPRVILVSDSQPSFPRRLRDLYTLTLRRDGEEHVLFTGDVSGNGFPAALLTASVEAFLAVMVAAGYAPHQICAQLSRQLFERTSPSTFVTASSPALDRRSGRLIYVNAGDNAALLAQPDGSLTDLRSLGFPLCMMKDSPYASRDVVMEPGATLLLYADGIIAARNRDDEEYGVARLKDRFLGHRHATPGRSSPRSTPTSRTSSTASLRGRSHARLGASINLTSTPLGTRPTPLPRPS